VICPDCQGSGHDELGFLDPTCGWCGGVGTVSVFFHWVYKIPVMFELPVRTRKYRDNRWHRRAKKTVFKAVLPPNNHFLGGVQ